MLPTSFPSKTTPWRVQVPGRFFPDKKRKTRYFATKEAAARFCQNLKKNPQAALEQQSVTKSEADEYAPLIAAAIARLGGDSSRLFEAITHFEATRLNVQPATVREAVEEWMRLRKSDPEIRALTWESDNGRIKKLMRAFEHKQVSQLTEADLRRFFDVTNGHKRSIYKTVNVFFVWAKKYNYCGVNPMLGIKAKEMGSFGVRSDIYPVETFERMLRISAGLEGARPGQLPTSDFVALLPWLVLSGFCGLRTCEAYKQSRTADAIKWTDLYFDRGFIEIRPSVAKATRRAKTKGDKRYIETAHYLAAAQAWLDLVPRETEHVVRWTYRKIEDLKAEFEKATEIEFLENALRNSFASYALTFDGLAGVGKLAIEMGNSEAICKQFYIRTLEPGSGRAWFGLRPGRPANVIPIEAAA